MIRKKKKTTGKPVIDLTGPQGNAFFLLGTAQRLAKQLGKDAKQIMKDMSSGDYEHLLTVFEKEFGDYVILER